MELQKLAVKILVVEPNVIPLTDFIDVFHGWIQATDGAYHDVADYSHMHAGPGIVLIANDANVSDSKARIKKSSGPSCGRPSRTAASSKRTHPCSESFVFR